MGDHHMHARASSQWPPALQWKRYGAQSRLWISEPPESVATISRRSKCHFSVRAHCSASNRRLAYIELAFGSRCGGGSRDIEQRRRAASCTDHEAASVVGEGRYSSSEIKPSWVCVLHAAILQIPEIAILFR